MCYNTCMSYEIKLKVFDKHHVFVGDSLKALSKQVLDVLDQDHNKWSKQAIKFVKQQRLFFRIDRDVKISCEMNKL